MEMTTTERRRNRAYLRDLLIAVVGYCAVLAVVRVVAGRHLDGALEWALALLPVLPVLWGVRAVIRHLRRIDEYQRLLQLEALAAGFGVAMVTALTLGFIGSTGADTGWIVYVAGMITWAAVVIVQSRRACRPT
jgi:hypothetical protein